ncbi:complexin-3-like isoform X2 [Betta splendens]|uniref:Complexin-3-like isoform X2 n=1 Tax=Betta splendens TaxID=158456 RepID=A0A9W2XBU1_BETSP|nr:complexin-3-like isoform X2 [Betta splendens]
MLNQCDQKLREAMNAQKNAERAAVRAHFRRKYQLAENPKDSEHLRSVGGKVSLPRELSQMIYPQARGKDGGFNLLSAFQGLGFGAAAPAGRRPDKPAAAAPSDADSCSVM